MRSRILCSHPKPASLHWSAARVLGSPLHHLSDSPLSSIPNHHHHLPEALGPGQGFVGGQEWPSGGEMGHAGDTGHPSCPYKERCTWPPNVTESPSLPSTQSDSTLETRDSPFDIPAWNVHHSFPHWTPIPHNIGETEVLHSPQVMGCVSVPRTPTHTQLVAHSDVPDTHTLPQYFSMLCLHGMDSPKLKSERSSLFLEHGLPHGHLSSVSPLSQVYPSVHPSVGGLQWPPSAARNFSSSCCRAVCCLLPSRALTRSGCSLPSASPAASSGGLVSACHTMYHYANLYHTCHIHPYQSTPYSATSCHCKPDANMSSPPHPIRPSTILAHHILLHPATPCHMLPYATIQNHAFQYFWVLRFWKVEVLGLGDREKSTS